MNAAFRDAVIEHADRGCWQPPSRDGDLDSRDQVAAAQGGCHVLPLVSRPASTLDSVLQADLPQAGAPTRCAHIAEPGSRAMLSEIFILRLEAVLRAPVGPGIGNSDTRFTPNEGTISSAKVEGGKKMSHSRVRE